MKQMTLTKVLGYLLVMLTGMGCATAVFADPAGDCRQEALDYGISPEELNDYISGCLASRGEPAVDDTADNDNKPLVEPDILPGTAEGDANAAQ